MSKNENHKIIFNAAEVDRVFSACCPDNRFDFNTLYTSRMTCIENIVFLI